MLFVTSKSQTEKGGKKAESLARSAKQLNPETKIDGEVFFWAKYLWVLGENLRITHKECVCVRQASSTLWGGMQFDDQKNAPFQGEGGNRRSS